MFRFFVSLTNRLTNLILANLSKRNRFDRSKTIALPQDIEERFDLYYQQHIQQAITEIESLRIQTLKKIAWRYIICYTTIGIFIFSVYIFLLGDPPLLSSKGHRDIFVIIGFFLFFVLVPWVGMPANAFQLSIKRDIYPLIFGFFGERFHYQADSPIQSEMLAPFGLLPVHHIQLSHYEDYISGSYEEINLSVTEALLVKHVPKGQNQVTFKGLFILLDIKTPFQGHTIIRKDSGLLGNWLQDTKTRLEPVKLEDPQFEKLFEVFSSDQIEARYLLTPSFMERLVELADHFDSKIECAFLDTKLLLKIPCSQNRFEVSSVYHTFLLKHDARHIIKEMLMIFEIIDMLKLNKK